MEKHVDENFDYNLQVILYRQIILPPNSKIFYSYSFFIYSLVPLTFYLEMYLFYKLSLDFCRNQFYPFLRL